MKEEVNKNKLGLTLGIFFAGLHFLWVIAVLAGIAQTFLDWIFPMHFLNNVYSVVNFSLGYALALVALAFVSGYIMGFVLAWLWNEIPK
ncbi:MAG: hypothetical protein KJ623_03520 [Nanoarchaeota archaeon]|nr:hypothetical protein [Nanoarchaeota archaeon]MBU0963274.1 hypothetical protein [Nanoarchaeota archaeon]